MGELISVAAENSSYPIYIEESFSNLKTYLINAKIPLDKVFIITDRNVAPLYYEQILEQIKTLFPNINGIIDIEGEVDKNLKTINKIYNYFAKAGLDRTSSVIALGGGVIGDIAGYAASTWKRGINFIQIPTTLLAQTDSAIGGKTGVNYKNQKNLIGTFYNPKMVYINISLLDSLKDDDFFAGMAEVIKYGIIRNKDLFSYISENRNSIKRKSKASIKYIIKAACKEKANLVSLDEKDNSERRLLNFGHTFGHAIEAELSKKLNHGQAVAIGMTAASFLSLERSYITQTDFSSITDLLTFFNLPTKCPVGIKGEKIFSHMLNDKKNTNNKINLILTKPLGNGFVTDNCSKSEIMNAISKILI